jgi:hypothetical protein
MSAQVRYPRMYQPPGWRRTYTLSNGDIIKEWTRREQAQRTSYVIAILRQHKRTYIIIDGYERVLDKCATEFEAHMCAYSFMAKVNLDDPVSIKAECSNPARSTLAEIKMLKLGCPYCDTALYYERGRFNCTNDHCKLIDVMYNIRQLKFYNFRIDSTMRRSDAVAHPPTT